MLLRSFMLLPGSRYPATSSSIPSPRRLGIMNLIGWDTLLGNKDKSSSNDTDDDDTTMKVMKGWLTVYTSNNANSPFTKLSARTQLLTKIKELVNKYKDETISIVFTGHILGASLSVLSAFDVVENVSSTIPVTAVSAIVFDCPEVGNKVFNMDSSSSPFYEELAKLNRCSCTT
ncbi:hypothetical protein IFM89_031004 [Coptis chinensis]|uniref:Phospholipase A1 n=1 Tax=Coptis chinensis TaxID=261450 RepID=A0A835H9W9_9MAGN|nr:hypothetical protein IFM89_031004 [Coptis chinensis]